MIYKETTFLNRCFLASFKGSDAPAVRMTLRQWRFSNLKPFLEILNPQYIFYNVHTNKAVKFGSVS